MNNLKLKKLIFLISITLFSLMGLSQKNQYVIPNNEIFKNFISSNTSYIKLNSFEPTLFKILPITGHPYNTFYQDLLFEKDFIYIFLPSSGVLYKSLKFNKLDKEIVFNRIDSTSLIKYNINCFSFVLNDTVYNIGGYGYWKWNGHLRYFNSKFNEWDIIPLNRELPIGNGFQFPTLWFNYDKKQLVSLNYKFGNEGVTKDNEVSIIDSVVNLNLVNKKWNTLGLLKPITKTLLNNSYRICDLDSGILINSDGNIYYLNLLDNTIYKLKNTNYKYFLFSKIQNNPISWVYHNNFFYAKSLTDEKINFFKINSKDFEKTNLKIYTNSSFSIFHIGLISILLIFIVVIFYSIHKKKNAKVLPSNYSINNTNGVELFTLIEKSLIKTIINNHNNNSTKTTVDEINKLLGVYNKSVDIQKRKRSDTINSINEKYIKISKKEEVILINRVRTLFDKRVNEFYINEEEFEKLENYL